MVRSQSSVPGTASAIEAAESAAVLEDSALKSTSLRSIAIVVLCTVLSAGAQILMRQGADSVGQGGIVQSILANWPLLAGYACLAANTILLVLALREGQLSILYPIIALAYVWVAILSPMFFDDVINTYKAIGIGLIVLGVSLIGAGSRS